MNYLLFIYFSILLHIINLFVIKCEKMDIVRSFMKAIFLSFQITWLEKNQMRVQRILTNEDLTN